MKKFMAGDIVLSAFPFTDLSNNKVRPCVVLACDRDDFVCVFITSKKETNDKFQIVTQDKKNNLKQISYVRYTKIATLSQKSSIGKIGELSAQDFLALKNNMATFLNIG